MDDSQIEDAEIYIGLTTRDPRKLKKNTPRVGLLIFAAVILAITFFPELIILFADLIGLL